jgi:hypothetical protein
MLAIKDNKRIFTGAEAADLTGICLEHLENLARRRNLGFIARDAEIVGRQADQRFFTFWDLAALVTLLSPCSHESLAA